MILHSHQLSGDGILNIRQGLFVRFAIGHTAGQIRHAHKEALSILFG